MTAILLSSMSLAAALAWVGALIIDPGPYDSGATFLIGLGLLAATTVGIVGLVLVGGRWAKRTVDGALAGTFLLAIGRPVDGWWIAGVILTSTAIVAVSARPVASGVRKLPAATGPPERSVLLTLVLIAAPFALGLASLTGSSLTTVAVGASAPLLALWYSRVMAGGLYLARYGWPVLALGLAPTQPIAAAAASALLGIVVAVIALHPSVKVAFYPPSERATVYPIPPELAPKEVLDAAELDEKGRRI